MYIVFYSMLYQKLSNVFSFVSIKQMLFCKRVLFLRPVFRVVLISFSKFWWGLPKKQGEGLAELRFLAREGG